jgi:predicted NUDIX family NTP pyrophosphohydrolase
MKEAAGIIPVRIKNNRIQVLLSHGGGPQWKGKNLWAIPKGGVEEGETYLEAAVREFQEETGYVIPDISSLIPLEPVQQSKYKKIYIWAV